MASRNGSANGNGKVRAKARTMPGRNGGTLKRGGNTTPGPGRPPGVFRQYNAWQLERWALVDFMADVARGVIPEANVRERMAAVEWLADRAYGRASQPIESEVTHHHYVVQAPEQLEPDAWLKQYAQDHPH